MERANVVNTEKVVAFVGALFHVINYIKHEKFWLVPWNLFESTSEYTSQKVLLEF